MQINQYIYGVSMIRYIGRFGSGPFFRLDGGIAKAVVQTNMGSASSDTGFGFIAGTGWSFDFGGERLLLNINYGYRAIDSDATGAISFSVGGLF